MGSREFPCFPFISGIIPISANNNYTLTTSNRYDFHAGVLNNKKIKMFEGKLGEKAVEMFFIDNGVHYIKDQTPHYERDNYDFLLKNNRERLLVDVKTRTERYHTRTLEMVEQTLLI